VTYDVASREPHKERSDEEMTETAEATATAIMMMDGRGRRGLRRSLVAGWRLTRRHQFDLVIDIDGEEKRTFGGRSHREEHKGRGRRKERI
jgi:hypothetical protein